MTAVRWQPSIGTGSRHAHDDRWMVSAYKQGTNWAVYVQSLTSGRYVDTLTFPTFDKVNDYASRVLAS